MLASTAVPPDGFSPHVPRFERDVTTRGVMFGVPCYGGVVHAPTMLGLREAEAMLGRLGIRTGIITITNESLVQRARNGIVAHFLETTLDRLLFVDADIGFTGRDVLRLLAHDRDVIGGLYRKKQIDRVDFAVNWLPNRQNQVMRDTETGALRCARVATGFMMVKRRVFEDMAQAFPQSRYVLNASEGVPGGWRDRLHTWFDCWIDPATGGYLSEDYAFCDRWRAMGGEVWCDPGLILRHHGTLCLDADPMEHLLAVPDATDAAPPAPPASAPRKPARARR